MPRQKVGVEDGWLHKKEGGSGRVIKWVRELGEWTKVQTIIRQGRGNYIKAAVKAGGVQWVANKPVEPAVATTTHDKPARQVSPENN